MKHELVQVREQGGGVDSWDRPRLTAPPLQQTLHARPQPAPIVGRSWHQVHHTGV